MNRLLTLLGDRARFTSRERIEAFLLLTELYNISCRVLPAHRDRAMEHNIEPGAFDPNRARYFSEVSTDFPRATIRRAQILEPQGRTVQPPALRSTFDIDAHGLYILFNGRPGSVSPIAGAHIDYAYRVSRRSVFGYAMY